MAVDLRTIGGRLGYKCGLPKGGRCLAVGQVALRKALPTRGVWEARQNQDPVHTSRGFLRGRKDSRLLPSECKARKTMTLP